MPVVFDSALFVHLAGTRTCAAVKIRHLRGCGGRRRLHGRSSHRICQSVSAFADKAFLQRGEAHSRLRGIGAPSALISLHYPSATRRATRRQRPCARSLCRPCDQDHVSEIVRRSPMRHRTALDHCTSVPSTSRGPWSGIFPASGNRRKIQAPLAVAEPGVEFTVASYDRPRPPGDAVEQIWSAADLGHLARRSLRAARRSGNTALHRAFFRVKFASEDVEEIGGSTERDRTRGASAWVDCAPRKRHEQRVGSTTRAARIAPYGKYHDATRPTAGRTAATRR